MEHEYLSEVNGVIGALDLDAGSYLLTILVNKGELYMGISEAVQIKPSLTTEYAKDFSDVEFHQELYIISFSVNGGTGIEPDAVMRSAGSGIWLPDDTGLTKTGYVSGGWNTMPDGAGTNYPIGFAYKVIQTETMYAV